MKSNRLAAAIAPIEFFDHVAGYAQNLLIARHLLLLSIGKISEQGKVQMFILIGEISYFELVDQGLDGCFIEQDDWHYYHRARFRRNTFSEINLRQ